MVGDLVPLLQASPPMGVELSPLHLEVTDTAATLGRLEELLAGTVGLSDAAKFWIGDLLLFAAHRYGDDGMIEAIGLSVDQAERYRLVCERIARSRRKEFARLAAERGLPVPSWTHFRLLARLDVGDQAGWYDRLLDGRWSTRELEDRLRENRALEDVRKGQIPAARSKSASSLVDAARAIGEIGVVLALADRALNGEEVAQEIADRLPGAAVAMKEVDRFVRQAADGLTLEDAVGRVLEAAVKQQFVADPAYLVPASPLEALRESYEKTTKGAGR